MRRTLLATLLLLLFNAPAAPQSPAPARKIPAVAFTNVTVIDMTGAAPRPRMTVVVAGERIAAVGRPGVEAPAARE